MEDHHQVEDHLVEVAEVATSNYKCTNKNNGFTLIELIATIAIMGIISILAFPSLNKVIATNKEKKFEYYATSLEKGAKLYIESHSKDLWDENSTGEKKISFLALKNDYLVKDYKTDNITCDNDNTYVIVNKIGKNKYTYKAYLKCTKNNNIVYEIK